MHLRRQRKMCLSDRRAPQRQCRGVPVGNQRHGRRLLATACPGPAAATAALLAPGAYDSILAAAPPRLRGASVRAWDVSYTHFRAYETSEHHVCRF